MGKLSLRELGGLHSPPLVSTRQSSLPTEAAFQALGPTPCGPQTPLVAALWDSVGEGVKQESSDGSLPRDRPLRLQDPEATGRGLRGGDTFLSLALP